MAGHTSVHRPTAFPRTRWMAVRSALSRALLKVTLSGATSLFRSHGGRASYAEDKPRQFEQNRGALACLERRRGNTVGHKKSVIVNTLTKIKNCCD